MIDKKSPIIIEADELSPGIAVHTSDSGLVVLTMFMPNEFQKPLVLTPDEARRLARALAEAGGKDEGK